MNHKCDVCKSEMELTGTKKINNTEYDIWKCVKCKHVVAKSNV